MTKPDRITQILEQMVDIFNGKVGQVTDVLDLSAPDAHRPNDAQFMAWWAISTGLVPTPPGFQGPGPNGEVYPPQVFVSPEGLPVLASPYEIALSYAVDGEKDLKRWQGIIERTLA